MRDVTARDALAGARLLLLGPGYAARRFLATVAGLPAETVATARDGEAAAALASQGIRAVRFDGSGPSPALSAAIDRATHILVSIPPGEADPVLSHHGADIGRAGTLLSIVYLSTVGVYGDHGGAWVDEMTPPQPKSARSRQRLAAEKAWSLAAEIPVAILRLAGIYGPGRNPLTALAEGTARSIVKPGQVFNRIHVDDIASAVGASLAIGHDGVVNVTDDEPAPPAEVNAFAAGLMGLPAPPLIPFEEADLSPMAKSFYGENKRVRNVRLRTELGVALAFPTYREGLSALWSSGAWRG
jgi:uncharacterized protein YbjT (DUF2867 family)